MTLDDNNRLHMPLSARSHGVCPMGYTYEVPDRLSDYFHNFNNKISALYNTPVPDVQDGKLVLATQLMTMATLYGEPLINGRTGELTRDFRAGRIGQHVTPRFLARP